MLILFDNGTPAPLRYALYEHFVVEAIERGWDLSKRRTELPAKYEEPENRIRRDWESTMAHLEPSC